MPETHPIPDDIKALSFEEALEELKAIVGNLESGDSKLDSAIAAYERGALLKSHCEAKLREAKAKIEKVNIGPDGVPSGTEDFDTD